MPSASVTPATSVRCSSQPLFSDLSYRCLGIKVDSASTYQVSFHYRFPGSLPSSALTATVSLTSTSGTVFARATTTLSSTSQWRQATLTIRPTTSAPNINNVFTVTINGASLPGGTVNFALFSLFPPTFKAQANGMRQDIAQVGNP